MNEYELLYVISPRLTADEVDGTVGRIEGLIEGAGGEVMLTDNWGRRRLAYPIKHHFEGTYVLTHLKLPSDRTAEFEGALQISEEILRHLFMRGIIPDYDGPPEQEVVEVRRPAPRAPRAEAGPPADATADATADAPAPDAAAERAPIEGAPAEQPATAEATAASPESSEAAAADAEATVASPESSEAAAVDAEATVAAPEASEAAAADAEATVAPSETAPAGEGEAEGAADAPAAEEPPSAGDSVPEGAEAPSPATASTE